MAKFKNKKEDNAILKHFLVEGYFWICQVQVDDNETCNVKLSSIFKSDLRSCLKALLRSDLNILLNLTVLNALLLLKANMN